MSWWGDQMADKTSFFDHSEIGNLNRHKVGASSLGNQEKWCSEGVYYKLDNLGYEGMSEVISSQLAKYTTLAQYGVTEYSPFRLKMENKTTVGCFSPSFSPNGCREVTLYKILTSYFNTDLKGVYKIYEAEYDVSLFSFFDFIRDLLLNLYNYDVLPWMTQLLRFDWLVLNEDRHFRNISFLLLDEKLSPAPLFDNGAALLSDLRSYPLEESIDSLIPRLNAKPFKTSFEKQVMMLERYQAPKLQFLDKRVRIDISSLVRFYPQALIDRAQSVLHRQMSILYPDVEVNFTCI